MKKLLGANRKMNKTRAESLAYINEMKQYSDSHAYATKLDLVICPQQPLLGAVADSFAGQQYMLGTQSISTAVSGAHTGESSPVTLADLGTKYAIIGHGERRTMYGEDATVIHAKLVNAIAHSIRPILCVGETLSQYEAGETKNALEQQLNAVIQGIDTTQIDVAYEPLRAIGTGKIPTNDEIVAAHRIIKNIVGPQSRVLYGGSVSATNCQELATLEAVDGFLVGGASLKWETFQPIVQSLIG